MEKVLTHKLKLIIPGKTLRCCKVRRILRYHVRNKLLSPEKCAYHVLFLLFLFRDEKHLLSDWPPLHQKKLQEQGVQDVKNRNKIKFETYGDLSDCNWTRTHNHLVRKRTLNQLAISSPVAVTLL